MSTPSHMLIHVDADTSAKAQEFLFSKGIPWLNGEYDVKYTSITCKYTLVVCFDRGGFGLASDHAPESIGLLTVANWMNAEKVTTVLEFDVPKYIERNK